VTAPDYSLRILGRGEDMVYRDSEGEVELEQTYVDGHRLYCNNTAGEGSGPSLSFERRKRIIENLCEYFEARDRELIFVLEPSDKDRIALERLFGQLRSAGHRIVVETDHAERRAALEDEKWLAWLRSGRTLSFDGVELRSEDDYRRWKASHRKV
jgi:hypothetical protein